MVTSIMPDCRMQQDQDLAQQTDICDGRDFRVPSAAILQTLMLWLRIFVGSLAFFSLP
jgi:hypothetical protein